MSPAPDATEFSCGYELTTEVRQAAQALVALGPDPDLWPGNVLLAQPAAEYPAELVAVPVPLGPLTLSSTLRNGAVVDLDQPTDSTYRTALSNLLGDQTVPSGTAVGNQIDVQSVFSQEGLSKTLGIDVDATVAIPFLGQLGLSYRRSTETTHAKVAVNFVQSYFQVSVDPHTNAAEYFGATVTPEDIEGFIDGDAAPVYVRSVTYGRRVIAVFEDDSRTDSVAFESDIRAAYGSNADFNRDSTDSVTKSRFSAIVLGDNRVMTTADELFDYLEAPPDMTQAWPIAYTLQYIGSESPFAVGYTTEVVTRSCEECGGSDPYADARAFGDARSLGAITDSDADTLVAQAAQIPPGQERWFSYDGTDVEWAVVDPAVSLSSDSAEAEVCIFAKCETGVTNLNCLIGSDATSGSMPGCCSTTGDVSFRELARFVRKQGRTTRACTSE